MKNANNIINFLTGLAGFISWFYLTIKYPNNTLAIASSALLILMGFGGRETIKEIIKIIKNNKDK